jgi:hypothetical protein
LRRSQTQILLDLDGVVTLSVSLILNPMMILINCPLGNPTIVRCLLSDDYTSRTSPSIPDVVESILVDGFIAGIYGRDTISIGKADDSLTTLGSREVKGLSGDTARTLHVLG